MKHVHKQGGFSILIFLLGLGPLAKVEACDTWVALANATAARLTILGKNSDRPQFDAQPLLFYPHRSWPEGAGGRETACFLAEFSYNCLSLLIKEPA